MAPPFVLTPMALAMTVGAAHAQVTFPDLVHRWPADGSAVDIVGSADGELHGAVAYVSGRFGQAFDIDAGGFVTFGSVPGNFGESDFTIGLWCRLDEPTKSALLTKRSECAITEMIDLRVNLDGDASVELAGRGGAGYTWLVTRRAGLGDGAWHHVAWRRSGPEQSVFVDGCLLVSPVSSRLVDVAIAAPLTIGKSPCTGGADGTMPFAGAIDEVQLYARALNDAEIRALAGLEPFGDLDGDGAVAGGDLGLLLGAWGGCAPCCPADLNGDGVVDGADIGALLGCWMGG